MGCGTAILIRKGIKFGYFNKNSNHLVRHLETLMIKVPLFPNKNLSIIAAYYPSRNKCSSFKSELLNLFQSLDFENMENYYILAGHLN